MQIKKIKKGDFVKVYQDPFTQQQYEGQAFVRRIVFQDRETAQLEVEFRDNPGICYARTVCLPAELVQGWPSK